MCKALSEDTGATIAALREKDGCKVVSCDLPVLAASGQRLAADLTVRDEAKPRSPSAPPRTRGWGEWLFGSRADQADQENSAPSNSPAAGPADGW